MIALQRETNFEDNLSSCINHVLNLDLGGWGSTDKFKGCTLVSNTHFQLGKLGENWFVLGNIPILRLIGQPNDLRECLILKVGREERLEPREITRFVDGDTLSDELFFVGHSGCIRFMLVGSGECGCKRGVALWQLLITVQKYNGQYRRQVQRGLDQVRDSKVLNPMGDLAEVWPPLYSTQFS